MFRYKPWKCPHCGWKNDAENRFCVECGRRLFAESAEESRETPQAKKGGGGQPACTPVRKRFVGFVGNVLTVLWLSGFSALLIQALRPVEGLDSVQDDAQAGLLLTSLHACANAATPRTIRISQPQANQLLCLLIPEERWFVPSVGESASQRLWVSFDSGVAICVLTTRLNFLRLDLAWKVCPILRSSGIFWEIEGGSLGKLPIHPLLARMLTPLLQPQLDRLRDMKPLLDTVTGWGLEPGLCRISWRAPAF